MFNFSKLENDNIVWKNGQFCPKHHAECYSCHNDLTEGIPLQQPVNIRFECDQCKRSQVIIQKYLKKHPLNFICRNTPPHHIQKLFLMSNNRTFLNMLIHITLLPPYKVCLRITLDHYSYIYSIGM